MVLNIRGVNGVCQINVEACKGMTKTAFRKKFSNRLVNLDAAFDEIQSHLKPKRRRKK